MKAKYRIIYIGKLYIPQYRNWLGWHEYQIDDDLPMNYGFETLEEAEKFLEEETNKDEKVVKEYF